MRKVRYITDVLYQTFEELSKERQDLELQKAIDNNRFYDIFADDMWRNYQEDLRHLQEKYELNIEPVFSNGSQHYIEKFISTDDKNNTECIWYKEDYFYVDIKANGHFEMYFQSQDTFDSDYMRLSNTLEKNLKLFINDFFEMYKHYKEHFMYGGCEAYEDFVKDMLLDEEFETVLDKKMRKIYDKRNFKKGEENE